VITSRMCVVSRKRICSLMCHVLSGVLDLGNKHYTVDTFVTEVECLDTAPEEDLCSANQCSNGGKCSKCQTSVPLLTATTLIATFLAHAHMHMIMTAVYTSIVPLTTSQHSRQHGIHAA
jgi:hypothetical protein